MTDESLQQFESPDPAVRRQAILDAGRAGDRRALPYLMKIYKTDPDPVMRELALKAGRRIKTLMDTGTLPAAAPPGASTPPVQSTPVSYVDYTYSPTPTAPSATSTGTFSAPPADLSPVFPAELEPEGPPAPIVPTIRKAPSPREREMAKSRVDMAITHKLQGNTEKAIMSLAEALRLNPDLETDGLAINLATALTGIPTAADAMVMVKMTAASAVKSPRAKTKNNGGGESSVTNTMLEVLIYFVLTVVLWLLIILVVSRQSDATLQELTRGQSRFATNPLRGIGFMFMMAVIFVSAGLSTLGTLFSNTIYWAIGIPLGGGGDWSRVISGMIRVQIIYTVVSAVLFGIAMWLFPVPTVTGSSAAARAALQQWVSGIDVMGILFLVTAIGALGMMAYSVGNAHNFGFAKGLVTIVIGTVVQCCACFVLGWAAASSVVSQSIR